MPPQVVKGATPYPYPVDLGKPKIIAAAYHIYAEVVLPLLVEAAPCDIIPNSKMRNELGIEPRDRQLKIKTEL